MTEVPGTFAEASGVSASQRSTPGLFEVEVAARPCRYPCDVPWHVHVETLPTNITHRSDADRESKPSSSSTQYEVR